MGWAHHRGHPRFVHENQPLPVDPFHLPTEGTRLPLHVGPLLFIGVLQLLLVGQVPPSQGAPDRRQAALEATAISEFF
jgi:hypothetical protein